MNTTASIDEEKISVDALRRVVDSLSRDSGIADDSYGTLQTEVNHLESIYGKVMPKALAFRLLSEQLELTKTGLIREPVDIVEFVESPEYMDHGAHVKPKVMEHLYNLFKDEDKYYEVVLGGSIGWGKNYFCDMAVAYLIYKMSCLYSPQAHYGLAPGSDIVFVHQSKTKKQAKDVVFNQFAAKIVNSRYFKKYFPPSSAYSAQLRFPHGITVFPVSSSDTAVIGMNVFVCILDELNFMMMSKRSVKRHMHRDSDIYDQAEVLYRTVFRRIVSRYEEFGKILGKVFLISSANYEGDFIDRKEAEAKALGDKSHIYVAHMSHWEAEWSNKLLPERFYVKLPTEYAHGRILEEKPEDMSGIIEVPENYRQIFEHDVEEALTDVAGIVSLRVGRFIMGEHIKNSFEAYSKVYGEEQIFSKSSIVIDEIEHLEEIINLPFLSALNSLGPFGAHCDLAKSDNAVGLAISHVAGARDIGARTMFDPKEGKFKRKKYGELPIYSVVGLLRVTPPVEGEIDINAIRDLLFLISEYIPLKFVNFDWYQSTAFIQSFRARRIASKEVSVVRTPSAYLELKNAMKEDRFMCPEHDVISRELRHLEQDKSTGEIIHRQGGSKDLSDSTAAVVFHFSDLKSSYRKKHKPIILSQPKSNQGSRPSSGRESLYGW